MKNRTLAIFSLGFIIVFRVIAADPLDYNKFDSDGKGIDRAKARAIALHATSPLFQMLDTNHNGVIEPDELAAKVKEAEEQAGVDEANLVQALPALAQPNGKVSVAEFAKVAPAAWQKAESGEYYPIAGIQVRRTLADVDLNRDKTKNDKAGYLKSLAKVNPAEFGFSHNGLSEDDSWFARGVIARPFRLGEVDSNWVLLPSAQFDRVTHSVNKTGEINSLIFGLGLGGTFDGGKIIEDHQLILTGQYATNFDFNCGIYGGALDYEPTFTTSFFPFKLLSNAQPTRIGGSSSPLMYRTRQWIHMEGGGSDGGIVGTTEKDYLRAGAGAAVDIFFSDDCWLRPLMLSGEYRYYFDLLGDSDDFYSFRTQAQWQLDKDGHFVLQAAYENGLVPLSQQKVDLVSVSLGIKF